MSDPIRKPDEFPSRSESILSDTIGLEGYSIETPPRSRIETLLIELKEIIGQGGGSSTAYATSLEITMDEYFVMSATLKNKDGDTLGQVQTVDLPLESVVVNGSYDSINKNVVLTLENGNTVSFSVADLVSGLQTEITSNNKLDADLVNDTNSTHKFTTASDISKLAGIEDQANKTVVDSSITDGGTNPVTGGAIYIALTGKLGTDTHYAGSSTTGGSANSAVKLDNSTDAGSATQPVYFSSGVPTATTYSLAKSVPADAVFTDTTYESKAAASGGTDVSLVTTGDKYIWNNKQNNIDANNKLLADLVDDTNATHKFATAAQLSQIATNENNISYNTNMGVKNLAPVSIIEKNASSEGFTVKTNCRLTAGDYIISFDYTSTSSATPALFNSNGALTKQLTTINGSGHKSLPFTVTSQNDIAGYYFYTVRAAKFENIMIRPALIEDSTYQPYAMSNAELTAKEQANENNIALLEQMNGKKNRFSTTLDKIKSANNSAVWSGSSTTINGVTYTVNEDLTIKAVSNGTNTLSVLYLGQITDVTTSDIITGCPKNSGASDTTFEFRIYNEGGTAIGGDTGNGWIPTSDRSVGLGILIRANQTVDLTFTPMICEKTMHDAFPDYQPYAMSNAELTAQRKTKRLGLWVTSFTVETPPFRTGTIVKVYIYKGTPDAGLSEYILSSESVSLVCGGAGVSYSISGSTVTFTTTSTCIVYAETLRFDV